MSTTKELARLLSEAKFGSPPPAAVEAVIERVESLDQTSSQQVLDLVARPPASSS